MGGGDKCNLELSVFIKSFRKSQFPRKFDDLFIILVIIKDKLTDLCGN